LIERDDFSSGASAHCFKVVHGGIRYVQHGDVRRMRSSCRERAAFLRIAPHLVAPLPFVIPTYGRGKSSKWFLGAGMLLYDALTADMNQHVGDPERRIHRSRFLGRTEALALFPSIEQRGLSGAAVFEDGQMYNPPRLVLGFVTAAAELGACVANYVEAVNFIYDGLRVVGVSALDRLDGERFEIRARIVINAAGPWVEGLLQGSAQLCGAPGSYSRDACFTIERKYSTPMALAVQGRVRDSDALIARNTRHLFLVPWRNRTLVGVWHKVVPREPDAVALPRTELRQFIEEFNASYPALQLRESEVRRADFGLVPFGEASRQNGGLSFGKQSRLIDHRRNGVSGLVSLISVRYTMARRDAVDALNLAAEQLGVRGSAEESSTRALPGGDIADFSKALRDLAARRPQWVPAMAVDGLLRNFGTRAERVLSLGAREPALGRCFTGSDVTYAEAVYSVREEMAMRMTDVVLRRTGLGTTGHPGSAALDEVHNLMRDELKWSEKRSTEERAALERHFERYLANAPNSSDAPSS
jgi:glycerol-3-phosphate dehydrogenase